MAKRNDAAEALGSVLQGALNDRAEFVLVTDRDVRFQKGKERYCRVPARVSSRGVLEALKKRIGHQSATGSFLDLIWEGKFTFRSRRYPVGITTRVIVIPPVGNGSEMALVSFP